LLQEFWEGVKEGTVFTLCSCVRLCPCLVLPYCFGGHSVELARRRHDTGGSVMWCGGEGGERRGGGVVIVACSSVEVLTFVRESSGCFDVVEQLRCELWVR
jgi:hypothetical protein